MGGYIPSYRLLVTGAAGFIGSHVTEALIADGHEVTGLDDLSTGRIQNLRQVINHPRFTFVEGNILDEPLVGKLVGQADSVIHLAAAVGVFTIQNKTLDSLRTNIRGTENVIAAAAEHDARLLLASTSEIYGKNTAPGLREDADRVIGSPLKSRWSYAEAKALDESLATAYANERGLRVTIVRFFNTVGPRQTGRYGMVIPRFVRQALDNEAITVFGTGEQARCFGHVADIVPAVIRLAGLDQAIGLAVNLGNPEQVTINNLAMRVIQQSGSTSHIEHISYQEAYGEGYEDMECRVPNCDLARELVGFVPVRDLDAIIRDVINFQRRERVS